MKLIDKDKFYDDGYILTHQAVWPVIEKQEVIKAIPIEWIEEYRQNREDYADEYNAKAVLKRLLETWEKENEISVMPVSDNSTIPLDYLRERK